MIFDQLWFWMLIASIVAVGFGIYVFEISRGTTQGVPIWSYLLIALGLVLLLIALIAAAAHYHAISEAEYIEQVEGLSVEAPPVRTVRFAPAPAPVRRTEVVREEYTQPLDQTIRAPVTRTVRVPVSVPIDQTIRAPVNLRTATIVRAAPTAAPIPLGPEELV